MVASNPGRLRLLIILVSFPWVVRSQPSPDPDRIQKRHVTPGPTSTRDYQIPPPSVSCELRSRCDFNDASHPPYQHLQLPQQQSSSIARNCFCDDLCGVYGDCCHDLRPHQPATSIDRNLRSLVTCQRLPDSKSGVNSSEVYVVTRCPSDYNDAYVRERCEKSLTQGTGSVTATGAEVTSDDRFYRLPVRGGKPLYLLYRNVYCAICSKDLDYVFYTAFLQCDGNSQSDRLRGNDLLRNLVRDVTCPTMYLPSVESMALPPARSCKIHIRRCDRSWTDKAVARKCRERTDYVYAGNRAFRNRECALCNYVNETYLRCEDNRSPSTETDGNYKIVLEEFVPYVVNLDLNRGRGIISAKKDDPVWRTRTWEENVTFPGCSDSHVYDPFVGRCRLVSCAGGYVRKEEDCVLATNPERKGSTAEPDTEDPMDRHRTLRPNPYPEDDNYDDDEELDDYHFNTREATTEYFPTQLTARQCPLLPVNSTDYRRFDNGSVYVISLQRTFTTDQSVWHGGTLSVCLPDFRRTYPTTADEMVYQSSRYNFTMFQFEPSQRSLSLVGAIVCLVALFIQLLIYAMFTSLWANTDGKCVLCLTVSLFFAQLLYMFTILVWEEFPGPVVCFVLTEVMQYCFLASFCWLNVVSIDVFRWLKSTDSSSTYSYIAEECCTRFVWYSIYAWTVPFIVVTGSVLTAILRIDGWHPYEDRSEGCWVMGLSQLMLFTLPICLLLAANFILYVFAACKLCFEPFLSRLEHYRNKYKHRCIISMQISVLMGMTWLFAIVAVVSKWTFLWLLFIIFDALQGIFVCAAFVCTKKVWRLFCSKGRKRRVSEGNGRCSVNNRFRGKSALSPTKSKNRVIMLETSI